MNLPLWTDEQELVGALSRRSGLERFRQQEVTPLFGGDLETRLRTSGTLALAIGRNGFVGILRVRGRHADLLDSNYSLKRIPLVQLVDAVLESAAGSALADAHQFVEKCGTADNRRAVARRVILTESLQDRPVGSMRRLSLDPGAGMFRQLRETGIIRTAIAFMLAHLAEACVWLAIWGAVGQASLSGRLDTGWMWGWILLLAALVPLRLSAARTQGKLAIGAGGLLKQRLMAGALRLRAGEVAQEGAGRFFSRVTEAEAVETLAISGALAAAVSIVEFTLAAIVLANGANSGPLSALSIFWLFLIGLICWRFAIERGCWMDARLAMTHDLVEQMSGHRTRLVQECSNRLHVQDDAALSTYHTVSKRMDGWGVCLNSLIPSGWLLAGGMALMPAFVGGAKPASLAVSLGGVLLSYQAMRSALLGASNLIGAFASWHVAAPLLGAATTMELESPTQSVPGRTVLDATDISFRYRLDGPMILNGLQLRIEKGDKAILEGPSGRGKSTLVSILCGLRNQGSGLLMSGGLDRESMGAPQWRKKVASAPQYHDNHILTGSLAFNLLMGRVWPPTKEDLEEAVDVCNELGLGELLARMPAGLQQMVGDTGWQLSQGERSRVFLARALLQQGELVILDESFAALDPDNLRLAMECSMRRAETLLVVAHA